VWAGYTWDVAGRDSGILGEGNDGKEHGKEVGGKEVGRKAVGNEAGSTVAILAAVLGRNRLLVVCSR
jgi:hypothetical protein